MLLGSHIRGFDALGPRYKTQSTLVVLPGLSHWRDDHISADSGDGIHRMTEDE